VENVQKKVLREHVVPLDEDEDDESMEERRAK